MPPRDAIDLLSLLGGQVTITPEENEQVRSHRLYIEARAARIEAWQGVTVFVTILAGTVTIAALAAYEALFDVTASPDSRHWAQTALTSLLTGALSFLAGKKIGAKA